MKIKGFSLIEIIIAIALAAIFLPAIGWALSISVQSTSQGENFSKAYSLAQDYMEAVYYLKSQNDANWDWTSTPVNTAAAEYYQPSVSGTSWVLGTKTTTPAPTGTFTKKVQIEDHPSIPHNLGRKITVYVTWLEHGQPQQVKLVSYVTAH